MRDNRLIRSALTIRFPQFQGTKLLLVSVVFLGLGLGAAIGADDLAAGFLSPPQCARPTCYWWWLRTPTTKEAITKDLEAMKAKGLSGAIICDYGVGSMPSGVKMTVGDTDITYTPTDEYKGGKMTLLPRWVDLWTPEWREMVRHASKESGRLGLEMGIGIGSGALIAKFVTPERAQQVLVWSETAETGGKTVDAMLPLGLFNPKGKPSTVPSTVFKEVAVMAVPKSPLVKPGEVIDLSNKVDASGKLHWDAPPGEWTVLRFSQVPTGHQFMGYRYLDMISADAMHWFWDQSMGVLLKEMTPDERKGLVYIEDDSWEGGPATWTGSFFDDFQRLRGYDLKPWMPVLAGKIMDDSVKSAAVQRDYRLTISDLIAEHYALQQKLSHEAGFKSLAEASGPGQHEADLLKSLACTDAPMAEFWAPSQHRPTPNTQFLARTAATASHVYGAKRTLAESFTSYGPQWEESPDLLKPVADRGFCDGVNWICLHNYSHSPAIDAKPGDAYSAGTHFERGNTWWDEAGAFFDYLSRCSYLLQQGRFVGDVVFYQGDDAINQFVPTKNPPPTLGAGYDYDFANEEVLIDRMNAKSGSIVLPDGMSYRALVLPDADKPLRLAALKKLAALVEAGATVVGPRPLVASGLKDDPVVFDDLVTRLWGDEKRSSEKENKLGQGRVIRGSSIREVLQTSHVLPDFETTGVSPKGVIDWIHRTTDTAEIYYVASRWAPPEKILATFRVSARQPELWNPVTGEIREATAFHQEQGRTSVPLELGSHGSVFVVFRKSIAAEAQGATSSNYPTVMPAGTLSGPWTVSFDPKWGGPADPVVFQTLDDWALRPETGIKYYSGTAAYAKTFDFPVAALPAFRLFLDLGTVKDVATVKLNGKNLGVVWTAPWRVEVTGLLRPKDNQLEIGVTNLWPNRLIGDEFLPEAQRFTVTNIRKYTRASQVLTSGLLGPVTIEKDSVGHP